MKVQSIFPLNYISFLPYIIGIAGSIFPCNAFATELPNLPAGISFIAKGSFIEGTPEVYKFKFANGLTLLALPDNRNPAGKVRISFNAGSNKEVKGKTGLAHFFEHMMFRKTKFTPEGHYNTLTSSVGASGNAATSSSKVFFYAVFPGPAIDTILELESQRMLGLDIVNPYFETEKGAVISERGLNYDGNPKRRGLEALNFAIERETPYEWYTIGMRDDVKNMKIEDAQKFYNDFYKPDNSIIAIGGPYDLEKILNLANKYFGKWEGKSRKSEVILPAEYVSRNFGKRFICSESVNESNIKITYPAITDIKSSYLESVKAQVLEQMLNDNPEGTVERRLLKLNLGTGFAVYKNFWNEKSQPIDAFFVINKDQKIEDVEKFWENELKQVLLKPLDEKIKRKIIKLTKLQRADISPKMTELLDAYEENEYYFGNFLADKDFTKAVLDLKEEDFRDWIKNTFQKNKSYISGVVPAGVSIPCAEFNLKN